MFVYPSIFQVWSEVNQCVLDYENRESTPKLAKLLKLLLWVQNELDQKKVKYPKMTDLSKGTIEEPKWGPEREETPLPYETDTFPQAIYTMYLVLSLFFLKKKGLYFNNCINWILNMNNYGKVAVYISLPCHLHICLCKTGYLIFLSLGRERFTHRRLWIKPKLGFCMWENVRQLGK